tara:strand:- start:81 stop:992 length:912 start_codon:yes stop_codon:yes gene_type:complete
MDFYTLIHIGAKQINKNIKGFINSDIYIYLACQLYKSLNLAGHNLIILSNKKNYINNYIRRNFNFSIKVINIEDQFSKQIPDFTKFKAAHAKIDCFKYFSELDTLKPIFLIDSDVLLLKDFPSWFNTHNLKSEFIYGYDITRHLVSGYGKHVVESDLKIFLKEPIVEWFGGEIIGASPKNFQILYKESSKIFETYLNNLDNLSHIGDETIFNVVLQKSNFKVVDLGKLNIIERKWSALCDFDQLPINTINKISLLHLPSSKNFILRIPIFNFKILKILVILFFYYSNYMNLLKKIIKVFYKVR